MIQGVNNSCIRIRTGCASVAINVAIYFYFMQINASTKWLAAATAGPGSQANRSPNSKWFYLMPKLEAEQCMLRSLLKEEWCRSKKEGKPIYVKVNVCWMLVAGGQLALIIVTENLGASWHLHFFLTTARENWAWKLNKQIIGQDEENKRKKSLVILFAQKLNIILLQLNNIHMI